MKLPAERRAPRSLVEADVDALINGCDRLRDRFLVVLLRRSGLRVGEALGLRHEDLNARRGEVTVCQRLNANGARAKSWSRVVPVEARVIRLYSDYLHEEYGTLDSDYVFVNLWGGRPGRPLRYASVSGLVQRLRARTGVEFTMHELRHTYATDLLRRGVAAEVVQKLLGHASITTTADTCTGLLLQLTARLRPEFAGDVILVGADDPVLGGPPCAVGDCTLVAILAGLLPTTALVYPEDYPRRDAPAPRAPSEPVMVQLESTANLARFADAGDRLLAEILMGTGLRVGDGAHLAVDCVVRDADGAPYLRYRNHKMRRDAFVPLAADLAQAVAARQAVIVERHAKGPLLFPRPLRNPDGVLPYCTDTFRRRLARWLLQCDVRDELGRPVHVTPHQWRHTYGTRLINAEVPQEVVRRLLDHASHSMTARYARLSDRTIRARWEAAHKVNVRGEEVAVEKGPLADAAWMKNNLARAKMALPNGFCALPLQQHCEYANACLTCAMFVTTVEFLPNHHRQLEATRELIAGAEERCQQRLAEMNRTVEANLVSIIGALEQPGCAADCSCSGVEDGTDPPSRPGDAS